MVKAFLHIRGPFCGNARAVFDLGAAAAAFFRIRLVRVVADHDRAHGKLLFLQSAYGRAACSCWMTRNYRGADSAAPSKLEGHALSCPTRSRAINDVGRNGRAHRHPTA